MIASSLEITSSNLSPIVQAFKTSPKSSTLLIHKNSAGKFSLELKPAPSLWEKYFIDPEPINTSTIENLKELVGERRLKRIFTKPELKLDPASLDDGSLELTEDIVKKLFVGVADIRYEDLTEKLAETGKSFKDLTRREDVDELYKSLLPFERIQDIFFHSVPQIGPLDRCTTSGKNFQGLSEKVFIVLSTREEILSRMRQEPLDQLVADAEMLTSRFADREPTEGAVICRPNGYFVCEKVFARDGAYMMLFRDLMGNEPAMLLCRGTAMRSSATGGYFSGLNDLLLEIGSMGFQSIKDELIAYLKEKQISTVDIFGKSLGGAHALYLAAFLPPSAGTIVRSVTTYCSVGMPDYIGDFLEKTQMLINIIRNAGDDDKDEVDYIPLVGGKHPCNSNTRLFYIASKQEGLDPEKIGIPDHANATTKLLKILKSFGNGHIRQTTLGPYFIREIKGAELAKEVCRGLEMENARKTIASWADFLSIGMLNQHLQLMSPKNVG